MSNIIVGAGISGLTLAYKLAEQGLPVTLIEREPVVGGLARSFEYGDWSIDIGPHRFHTSDPEVSGFIEEVLTDGVLKLGRSSKVYFCDKHLDWPLNLESVLQLPPALMVRSFFDLFFRPQIADDSFESYVMSKYGKTLTDTFFREYTYKFLKLDLKQCHRHWAEAGINRAIIDEKVSATSIVEMLKGILARNKDDLCFLYPEKGPIAHFCNLLAKRIEAHGGIILTGTSIEKLALENGQVKEVVCSGGEKVPCERLFWSGDIADLERLAGLAPSGLEFCSTVCCNVLVRGTPQVPSQWEYFGSREIVFSRVSTSTMFNKKLAPEGHYGLCVELVCYEHDFIWRAPENLLNTVLGNLIHTNLLRNYSSVESVHFEKVKNTYPLYFLDYPGRLANYTRQTQKLGNALCFGRCGGFWYNNMDHSMKAALEIAQMLRTNETELFSRGVYRGAFFSD